MAFLALIMGKSLILAYFEEFVGQNLLKKMKFLPNEKWKFSEKSSIIHYYEIINTL